LEIESSSFSRLSKRVLENWKRDPPSFRFLGLFRDFENQKRGVPFWFSRLFESAWKLNVSFSRLSFEKRVLEIWDGRSFSRLFLREFLKIEKGDPFLGFQDSFERESCALRRKGRFFKTLFEEGSWKLRKGGPFLDFWDLSSKRAWKKPTAATL
jgi:hypothetical protein